MSLSCVTSAAVSKVLKLCEAALFKETKDSCKKCDNPQRIIKKPIDLRIKMYCDPETLFRKEFYLNNRRDATLLKCSI